MPYTNYNGVVMPESATPTSSVQGNGLDNQTIQAPQGPVSIDPAGGKNVLMIAGQGDDTFIIRDPSEMIRVDAGLSGVKTADAFTSYVLPVGVQNLTFSGSYAYGVGNDADNLIIAGDQDGITIDGGKGNDVLVGGLGHDTFVVAVGEGNDVIYNWQARDAVSLRGASFTTFAQVTAAMTQTGSDVVLQLDPTETLTFRNVKISDFAASNFLLKLDASVLGAQTFHDEFNSLSTYSYATNSGNWRVDFGLSPNDQNNYALFANQEKQAYVSSAFQGKASQPLGLNPFSFSNGVMTITASELTQDQSYYAYGQPVASGMLNTKDVFEQKYGYFEIKASLPTVAGLWPAFWMTTDKYTGQEADIMESLGQNPLYDYVRADASNASVPILANALKPGDVSGFHTYGLLWTPTNVTFYYDGYAILQAPTPSTWQDPMYMILDLAVGGWGGQWDPKQLPAGMQVDYIHAYALADGSSVVKNMAPAPSNLIDARNVLGWVNAANNTADQALTGYAQAGATVTVYDGQTVLGTTTANAQGVFTYTLGQMAEGGHNLLTAASTAPGLFSATLSFFVDSLAPAAPQGLTDSAVSNGHVPAANNTPAQTLTGTSEGQATIAIYDGTTRLGVTLADEAGNWSYTLGPLSAGGHSLTAVATDRAGNVGQASAALQFTVDSAGSGPSAPFGLADAAIVGGYVNAARDTAGQTLTGSSAANAVITVYDSGTKLGTVQASGTGTWSYALGALPDGAHSLTATATDASNAVSAGSAALAFTVDTLAPAAPVSLADSAIVAGYVNAAHNRPGQALTGTAEANAVVSIYDGQTKLGTTTANASGAFSYTLGQLTDGAHSLTAIAADAAGNTGAASAALAFRVGQNMRDDFTGHGHSDALVETGSGGVMIGELGSGAGAFAWTTVSGLGPEWSFRAHGQFLGDGKSEFLIENNSGTLAVGSVSGGATSYTVVGGLGPEWSFKGSADLLGRGSDQFIIENSSGAVAAGAVVNGQAQYTVVAYLGSEWKIIGGGDFLGDGHGSLLMENSSGAVVVGEYRGGAMSYTAVGGLGPEWKFVGIGDYLGHGDTSFLLENTSGGVAIGEVVNGHAVYTAAGALGPEWSFVGSGAYTGTGADAWLIENSAGAVYTGQLVNGQVQYAAHGSVAADWHFH